MSMYKILCVPRFTTHYLYYLPTFMLRLGMRNQFELLWFFSRSQSVVYSKFVGNGDGEADRTGQARMSLGCGSLLCIYFICVLVLVFVCRVTGAWDKQPFLV